MSENSYKEYFAWLDKNFLNFLGNLGIDCLDKGYSGIIIAHGDKCEQYKKRWEDAGVPYYHGACLYLLSHSFTPWCHTVRKTPKGWIDPCQWVIDHYSEFKDKLPQILKPCPFCGGNDISVSRCDNDGWMKTISIVCGSCGCRMESKIDRKKYLKKDTFDIEDQKSYEADTQRLGLEKWNTRA